MTDPKVQNALDSHDRLHEVERKLGENDNPVTLELTASEATALLSASIASFHAASVSMASLIKSLVEEKDHGRDMRYIDDLTNGVKFVDAMLDITESGIEGRPRVSFTDDEMEKLRKGFRRASTAAMAVMMGIDYEQFDADVSGAEMVADAEELARETGALVVPGNTSVN